MVGKGVCAYTFVMTAASLILMSATAKAEQVWTAQLFGGSAYNFKTPLRIRQNGEEEIKVNARYTTRTFDNAPYYVLRLGRWHENRAWEFEHIHHKIFLKNRPPEIGHFQIEHGYNLFTLNRAWRRDGFVYRLGAGLAVTRPITTIRGKESRSDGSALLSGYQVTGGGLQLGAEKRVYFSKRFFLAIEGKLVAAWVRIRVIDGRASVPNIALHGLLGFGSDF